MSSATVHMVGKALLVFICPRFSRAFSTSSWLAEKYMTSFSSGSPWNLAEISSFSRSHSCFFMTRISTEFPCLNTSSENKIERKNELTNTGTTCCDCILSGVWCWLFFLCAPLAPLASFPALSLWFPALLWHRLQVSQGLAPTGYFPAPRLQDFPRSPTFLCFPCLTMFGTRFSWFISL